MIDWNRIAELRADVGDDALAEVVAVFVEEMDATVACLRGLPDSVALADELHLLKGASSNLGLGALSALADTGETIARAGQGAAELGDVVAQIETLYASSRADLMRALPGSAPVTARS